METTPEIDNNEQSVDAPQANSCKFCSETVAENETYCHQCGYPQNGTEQERYRFKNRLRMLRDDYNAAKTRIKWARVVLYIIGGFFLIVGLLFRQGEEAKQYLMYGADGEILVNIVTGVLIGFAVLFIACGLLAAKYPLPALLSGLLLYCTFVLIGIIQTGNPFSAIIWNIIFITALIRGISQVRKSKAAKDYLSKNQAIYNRIFSK